MKYNLLLIANKPSAAVAMTVVEYDTYQAALDAVELLKEGLASTDAYSVKYFVTAKGEKEEC